MTGRSSALRLRIAGPARRALSRAPDDVASGKRKTCFAPGSVCFSGEYFAVYRLARHASSLDQLVDRGHGRRIGGRREIGADAKHIDRRAGCDELGDPIFVQIARRHDLCSR